jgi:hypothetical protein
MILGGPVVPTSTLVVPTPGKGLPSGLVGLEVSFRLGLIDFDLIIADPGVLPLLLGLPCCD